MAQRKIVIPGEKIIEGAEYLPGENTEKRNGAVVATRYGLSDVSDKLVKVIPVSGTYKPRRGNVVIGEVENLTFNGWIININSPARTFLPLTEVPRFVPKNALEEVMDIGDMVVVKLFNVAKKGIDLTLKDRGLGKITEGLIVQVNPNKVPRIIGKEGSMVKLIKEKTNCNLTVGQNGFIWIKGENVEDELFAKKTVKYIEKNAHLEGLTDKMEDFFSGDKE